MGAGEDLRESMLSLNPRTPTLRERDKKGKSLLFLCSHTHTQIPDTPRKGDLYITAPMNTHVHRNTHNPGTSPERVKEEKDGGRVMTRVQKEGGTEEDKLKERNRVDTVTCH